MHHNAGRIFVDDACFSLGTTEFLSFEQVLNIMKEAKLCHTRTEDEASWNQEVHHSLFKAVLRPDGKRGLVDFMGWLVLAPIQLP